MLLKGLIWCQGSNLGKLHARQRTPTCYTVSAAHLSSSELPLFMGSLGSEGELDPHFQLELEEPTPGVAAKRLRGASTVMPGDGEDIQKSPL